MRVMIQPGGLECSSRFPLDGRFLDNTATATTSPVATASRRCSHPADALAGDGWPPHDRTNFHFSPPPRRVVPFLFALLLGRGTLAVCGDLALDLHAPVELVLGDAALTL